MRTEKEVEKFFESVNSRNLNSEKKYFYKQAYEGCLPFGFFNVLHKKITHNKEIFENIVVRYVQKIDVVLKNGYGLIFTGDNGTGKTHFVSYILSSAIKKRRTVYYTTLPELENNLKRGFSEWDINKRLDYFLSSDFLAIDEVGKELVGKRRADNYINCQFERILKKRFDDNMPTILVSNLSASDMCKTYGSSVESILNGKYRFVQFETGDYRAKLSKRMGDEMGY
jgi:DNA replication protein DnaC